VLTVIWPHGGKGVWREEEDPGGLKMGKTGKSWSREKAQREREQMSNGKKERWASRSKISSKMSKTEKKKREKNNENKKPERDEKKRRREYSPDPKKGGR